MITGRLVFSSSKVMIRLFPLFSYFSTPGIFFRIELILAADPQEEQPGMDNCTALSSARAKFPMVAKKTRIKTNFNIFFITHTTF
jgi:hypothetical protein